MHRSTAPTLPFNAAKPIPRILDIKFSADLLSSGAVMRSVEPFSSGDNAHLADRKISVCRRLASAKRKLELVRLPFTQALSDGTYIYSRRVQARGHIHIAKHAETILWVRSSGFDGDSRSADDGAIESFWSEL